jgi:hypothetical protein
MLRSRSVAGCTGQHEKSAKPYISRLMRISSEIRLLPFALAVPLALAGRAAAQAGGDSTTVIRGVVYDSLITVAPLVGAEVWVEGTNLMARTDAEGRFALTGLKAGRYRLIFYHPVLDSTRLSAPPVIVDVESASTTVVRLTTPSAIAVHRAFCPHDPLQGTGVLLGLTREGASGQPLANIPVTAEWSSIVLGPGIPRQESRAASARSDSSGRVILCNVPTDVPVLVRGKAAEGPAGMLLVDLAGRPFGRVDLQLATHPSTGAVTGVVRNRRGSMVPSAQVLAAGSPVRTEADGFGQFQLLEVEAGSRIIEARAIGYSPARVQTTIVPGAIQRVEIVLGDSVQVLDPIAVNAGYQPYLARVGFDKRRSALQGHFLDQKDIERTGATRFEEVFRLIPGVTLRPSGMGFIIELQRGQGQITNPRLANYCPPSYFIDGIHFPLPPNETLTLPMVPDEVLGIEVYSNIFSAPPQYQRRDGGCGIILIWTKRGVPNRER